MPEPQRDRGTSPGVLEANLRALGFADMVVDEVLQRSLYLLIVRYTFYFNGFKSPKVSPNFSSISSAIFVKFLFIDSLE